MKAQNFPQVVEQSFTQILMNNRFTLVFDQYIDFILIPFLVYFFIELECTRLCFAWTATLHFAPIRYQCSSPFNMLVVGLIME